MNLEDPASPWALLAHIDKITGIFNSDTSLIIVRNTLHVSLLGKLWVDTLLAAFYQNTHFYLQGGNMRHTFGEIKLASRRNDSHGEKYSDS